MRKVQVAAPAPIAGPSQPPIPHSPLSPSTPTSPLYPDGLIAPVWVRKHAELVPSVFVLFLRLYESALPPEEGWTAEQEAASRDKEREEDDSLIREIGDRRRRLGERGIKLTVVLMASASTLGEFACGYALTRRLARSGSKIEQSPSCFGPRLESLVICAHACACQPATGVCRIVTGSPIWSSCGVLCGPHQASPEKESSLTYNPWRSGWKGTRAARLECTLRLESGMVCGDSRRVGRS